MVYNAMKLFMEVNPQLFDDCSHEYKEQQNNAPAVKANRQERWDRLSRLADSMKANGSHDSSIRGHESGHGSKPGSKATTPPRKDESDPMDNQQRLERLRLQDDRANRPKDYERHGSSAR